MKLYMHPASPNCRKVLAVIHHLNLAVEMEVIDLAGGAHHRADFLRLNPFGRVPVLEDNGFALSESHAIMQYLCEKTGSSLWPVALDERAKVVQFLAWQLAHFWPAAGVLIGELMFKPRRGARPDVQRVAEAKAIFSERAQALNDYLAGRSYLVGFKPTLADFAVAATLTYADSAELPLTGLDHIAAWQERMDQLPAWAATRPKMV